MISKRIEEFSYLSNELKTKELADNSYELIGYYNTKILIMLLKKGKSILGDASERSLLSSEIDSLILELNNYIDYAIYGLSIDKGSLDKTLLRDSINKRVIRGSVKTVLESCKI